MGIEILSKTDVMIARYENIGKILAIIIIISFLLGLIIISDGYFYGLLFIVIALICFCGNVYCITYKTPSGKYEYKAIVPEDYPFVKLYEKYEVVGQDGKIWILRDKDEE